MLERMRANPDNSYLGLMLALTFSTGIIDAVGYLGLDRVFTGNMTGNVVILGMGLAGADELPVLGPAVALVAFMAGAAAGGRVLRGSRDGWTGKHTALFGAVAAVLVAGAITVLTVEIVQGSFLAYSATAALGLAMGCQAATARHIAVKDVTTVVVTSTITGLASDSVLGKGGGQPWARRAGAVVLIGAGAATGALLLNVNLGAGMLLSAAITIAVLALGHITRPGRGPRVPYDGVISQG
ncbi:YoaK family protein [Demequina zhanjiangensis]|uniref:YoaK family protein n=1 Tax=Demequina zhanjiangensis TaxID=3051659 RepID=A0ABT8FY43_9MICO|nr:YoaK family protein [Demequina sp. SYSU T00b26]MDN4471820.1 YoaK family protein [Demequina sp. SYSU T00b26]